MDESVRSGGEAGSSSLVGELFHHGLVNRVRLITVTKKIWARIAWMVAVSAGLWKRTRMPPRTAWAMTRISAVKPRLRRKREALRATRLGRTTGRIATVPA